MSHSQQPRQFTTTYEPDRLIAGLAQIVTANGTLLSGQNLLRGAVLGRITASSKYTLSLAASSDGSEVPRAILADDYDASAGDLSNVAVYLKGEFNYRRCTFGTGHTFLGTRDALRDGGIYLVESDPA